jgi:antirestriction protein ArdC
MATQTELRQEITNRIIESLKSGNLPPWRQPWSRHINAGSPTNVTSKRRYSGVNPLLLRISAARHRLKSKYWATFNQWQDLGGKVMRRPDHVPSGQWGTSIVFFKPINKTEIDPDTGEEEEVRFGILKNYTVFNVDQVEGDLDHLRVSDTTQNSEFIDYEPAEEAIQATSADIRFGGDRAFYRRGDDFIQMPHRHHFKPQSEFYATALHELMHWSESRLQWTGNYAEGELRAEIGACYALTELGAPQSEDLTNHHAYVESWLNALENDPRFIFAASSAASKATDFVLSFSREMVNKPDVVLV